ncbi:MAG: ribokinase [Planktomarina sp.]
MTVYNLGSINADMFYEVPHIPVPGETLAAKHMRQGLGGKGANQSVALIRSGAEVKHIGAVGPDGDWMLDRLNSLGLDTDLVAKLTVPSGHAIINVADDGENAITLFPGANQAIPSKHIKVALADIGPDDWLVLQNETNGQTQAIDLAIAAGARICYSAAPFDADATKKVLDKIDILAVNEGEANELLTAMHLPILASLDIPAVLMTRGAQGAVFYDLENNTEVEADALNVTPVDTTGAGDTFLGFFIGRLDAGDGVAEALQIASQAAALKVTRPGTADAIPALSDVLAFSGE